ncbi:MAG: tetratricopeptide repeat protein [Acidobacteriota bacterium]
MAKQRRPSKPAQETAPASAVRPALAPPPQEAKPPAPASPSVQGPSRRSTYIEAVAIYEQGLDALQHHDYPGAAQLFESVLLKYPEEKDLQERVRLYLTICQRHAGHDDPTPKTIGERLFASTLAINGGKYDEALSHLRLVRDEDPDNDHALYMLAVAHAQRGEHAEAIAHLERAIAMNPENRGLARHDPDLEPLRGDESFRAALEVPIGSRSDRRRPFRTRTGR